jgi:putative addiction module component (TIGR02574 family)
MTVQTIPAIERMTPTQQIELMEALWKSMNERALNTDPPEWHRQYLKEREEAISNGEDEFITLDEFEEALRKEL